MLIYICHVTCVSAFCLAFLYTLAIAIVPRRRSLTCSRDGNDCTLCVIVSSKAKSVKTYLGRSSSANLWSKLSKVEGAPCCINVSVVEGDNKIDDPRGPFLWLANDSMIAWNSAGLRLNSKITRVIDIQCKSTNRVLEISLCQEMALAPIMTHSGRT